MTAPVFPAFNDWSTNHRGLIARLADRHRIELDDAKQEAWLAWDDACVTWNPARGASLNTWALRKLENRLRGLAAQCRHGLELDADDAPELAGAVGEELECWRTQEAGAAGEALADALRAGTATIAERLGVTQRRARQVIAGLVEQARAGTPQLELDLEEE